MKFITAFLFIHYFINIVSAQTVNYQAGQIQSQGTQLSIGMVCKDPNLDEYSSCKKIRFVLTAGSLVSELGSKTIEVDNLLQNLNTSLLNFSRLRGINEDKAKILYLDLQHTLSRNSNIKPVPENEFELFQDFIKNLEYFLPSTSTTDKTGSIGINRNSEIYSNIQLKGEKTFLYLKCADSACERIIAIENKFGIETSLNTFARKSLDTLTFKQNIFRDSKKVFHAIKTVTKGDNATGGFWNWFDSELNIINGFADVIVSVVTVGAYPTAYALSVTAISVAGTATTLATAPIHLIQNLSAPNSKLESIKEGKAIRLSAHYYHILVNKIIALK